MLQLSAKPDTEKKIWIFWLLNQSVKVVTSVELMSQKQAPTNISQESRGMKHIEWNDVVKTEFKMKLEQAHMSTCLKTLV